MSCNRRRELGSGEWVSLVRMVAHSQVLKGPAVNSWPLEGNQSRGMAHCEWRINHYSKCDPVAGAASFWLVVFAVEPVQIALEGLSDVDSGTPLFVEINGVKLYEVGGGLEKGLRNFDQPEIPLASEGSHAAEGALVNWKWSGSGEKVRRLDAHLYA